jgi:hypothetical protein
MCYRLDMEPASQRRHRGLTIVGVLMILFGAAEVITAFTRKFFGISTALGAVSAVLVSGFGTLYTIAGLLLLMLRRRAAALAVACLVVVLVGSCVGRVRCLSTRFIRADIRHGCGDGNRCLLYGLYRLELASVQVTTYPAIVRASYRSWSMPDLCKHRYNRRRIVRCASDPMA